MIDLSYKILYTWQVVGVGAGHIVNVFNHRLFLPISFATRTGCGGKLRLTFLGGPTRLRTYYKSALRALEASLLFFIFFSGQASGSWRLIPISPAFLQCPLYRGHSTPELDPRSLGADQLITSVPTRDLGSSLAKLKAKVPHGFSVAFS